MLILTIANYYQELTNCNQPSMSQYRRWIYHQLTVIIHQSTHQSTHRPTHQFIILLVDHQITRQFTISSPRDEAEFLPLPRSSVNQWCLLGAGGVQLWELLEPPDRLGNWFPGTQVPMFFDPYCWRGPRFQLRWWTQLGLGMEDITIH